MTTTPNRGKTMSDETRQDIADQAARLVAKALVTIQNETGIATDLLLAGAHAQVVAMTVTHLGGPMAAAACERAARNARHLPSLAACMLAGATPAGRA